MTVIFVRQLFDAEQKCPIQLGPFLLAQMTSVRERENLRGENQNGAPTLSITTFSITTLITTFK
jgi:hypothetical protein